MERVVIYLLITSLIGKCMGLLFEINDAVR